MRIRQIMRKTWLKMLTGITTVTLVVPPSMAEDLAFNFNRPRQQAPPCCPPGAPTTPAQPPTTTTTPPSVTQPPTTPMDLTFASPTSGAGFGDTTSVPMGGYIDSAKPMTQFRVRYDAAFDNNRPDRAEFIYPKCGCFRGIDPNAAGPPPGTSNVAAKRVDFQELHFYGEYAPSDNLSVFVNLPIRWLNPDTFDNFSGLSDIDAGFKYAVIADMNRYLTFQFRTYIPTGDGERGLGTEHVSVEPALLYYQRLNCNWAIEAEAREWVGLGGSDFRGNIFRYGVGTSYTFDVSQRLQVAPVAELVGWYVFAGQEFDATAGVIEGSAGTSILNAKIGLRANLDHHSVYVGYGRALTGEVWYKDIIRVEYRFAF